MKPDSIAALVMLLLLILSYVIPYTILGNTRGWDLYMLWTILSLAALIAAWWGARSWREERL